MDAGRLTFIICEIALMRHHALYAWLTLFGIICAASSGQELRGRAAPAMQTMQQRSAITISLRKRLAGHLRPLQTIRFSPEGKILATASDDKTAMLWDVRTGQLRAVLPGHKAVVSDLVFSPDGRTIATLSSNTAQLWDVETARLKLTLSGHKGFIWQLLFSPDGKSVLTSSADKTARLWDTEAGQLKATLTGHKEAVFKALFSPDGQTIVSGGGGDNSARLWDARTGELKAVLKAPRDNRLRYGASAGNDAGIYDLLFSPDGRIIAAGDISDKVTLWDARTGQLRATLTGHQSTIYAMEFSPNGRLLATASRDGTAKVWDVATGQLRDNLTTELKQGARYVAFSPDGQTLAVGYADKALLWDVATGRMKASLQTTGLVRSMPFSISANWGVGVSFSPDSRLLLTTGKEVRLWDAASGELIATLSEAQRPLIFSVDGRTLATIGRNNTSLLWDVSIK